MGNYKIVFDKQACIGSANCAAISPNFWKMRDRKSDLKNAILNPKSGKFELVIPETELGTQKQVIQACPVECIKIEKA